VVKKIPGIQNCTGSIHDGPCSGVCLSDKAATTAIAWADVIRACAKSATTAAGAPANFNLAVEHRNAGRIAELLRLAASGGLSRLMRMPAMATSASASHWP